MSSVCAAEALGGKATAGIWEVSILSCVVLFDIEGTPKGLLPHLSNSPRLPSPQVSTSEPVKDGGSFHLSLG